MIDKAKSAEYPEADRPALEGIEVTPEMIEAATGIIVDMGLAEHTPMTEEIIRDALKAALQTRLSSCG